MNYEFQALDEREFEETRQCLLNIAHSKNQTHAGYLIAIIIGTLTLVSRWDTFFDLSQKSTFSITTFLFFGIISASASVTFYLVKRSCYWTSYGSSVMNMTIIGAQNFFEKYRSKPENKSLCERVNPPSCILNAAVSQRLEDLYLTKKEHVGKVTRFGVMRGKAITFLLTLEVGLTVLWALLIGYILL
jgi:hypothetical protein